MAKDDITPETLQGQHLMETYRGLVPLASGAMKTALLLNGGAAVALLALLGNLMATGQGAAAAVDQLKDGLLWFVCGLACIGGASVVAYLSQLALFDESQFPNLSRPAWRRSEPLLAVALWLVIISIALFVFGCLSARQAF
jgi:hypothetical protein